MAISIEDKSKTFCDSKELISFSGLVTLGWSLVYKLYVIVPGELVGNDIDRCSHVIDVVGRECLNVLGKAENFDLGIEAGQGVEKDVVALIHKKVDA